VKKDRRNLRLEMGEKEKVDSPPDQVEGRLCAGMTEYLRYVRKKRAVPAGPGEKEPARGRRYGTLARMARRKPGFLLAQE